MRFVFPQIKSDNDFKKEEKKLITICEIINSVDDHFCGYLFFFFFLYIYIFYFYFLFYF